MIKFFKKNDFLLLKLFLVILILLHGLFGGFFKVDNITILLILIFVLLPYIQLVKKIKFGEFEAEITHEDVKNIEDKIKKIPQKEEREVKFKKSEDLRALAQSDPTLALAKARIEIEKKIKSLGEIYLKKSVKYSGLRTLILELKKNEIINHSLEILLQDVVAVANRAIHGESVENKDAVRLVDYASRAIEELDHVVISHALKSESKKIIKSDVVESHIQGKYILKTIVPYVKNPEIRTYRLNQAELNAFLEGYGEYAEFIVSLEKSKNKVLK